MNEKHKIDFLEKTELFSSLADMEMDLITNKMVVKQFKKNETILYEDDTNKYMYIILSGSVKAVRATEDGKEIILAMHKAGSFFGEMSLIDGMTTPAAVISTTDSLIAVISSQDFFSILFSQKKVVENLLKILCSRLRKCWDTIQLLNFNNASQRAKMLFIMLSDEYGKETAEGVVLTIKLTHQDISNMTGLTRETVTRVIDKLQKNGEISVMDKKFIRLNPGFVRNEFTIEP